MKLILSDDQGIVINEWRIELEQNPPDNINEIPFDTWYMADIQDQRTYGLMMQDIVDEVKKAFKAGML